jgi:tetratricopeptide (TPR) repeat protein
LELSLAKGRTQARAKALWGQGFFATSQNDYGAARPLLEESLAIYQEIGDEQGASIARNSLANIAMTQGDYTAAQALHQENLSVRRALADREGIAQSLHNLGCVALYEGDYSAARALFEESWTYYGEEDALSPLFLGIVAYREHDYARARPLIETALSIYASHGYKARVAEVRLHLGNVVSLQGDQHTARTQYCQSLKLYLETEDQEGACSVFHALATRVLAQEQPQRATEFLGAAAALRDVLGLVVPPAERPEHEAQRLALRDALGEVAFSDAWERGRTMTWKQAAAFVLDESAA